MTRSYYARKKAGLVASRRQHHARAERPFTDEERAQLESAKARPRDKRFALMDGREAESIPDDWVTTYAVRDERGRERHTSGSGPR